MSSAQDKPSRPCPKCGYDLTGVPSEKPCPECGSSNNCVRCGYNLVGLKHGTKCPECGKVSPNPDAHNADKLDAFCFCTGCGYHLYTIDKDASCPECGQPASESAIEQSLYRSGATYFHSLYRGYLSVLVGLIVLIVGPALVFGGPTLTQFIARLAGAGTNPFAGMSLYGILFLACTVGGGLVLLVGSMTVTMRDPHLGAYADSEKVRMITRFMAIINFLLYCPGMICLPFVGIATGGIGMLTIAILYIGCAATLIITSVAYTEHIARRLGTKRLIKATNTYSVVLIILMALSLFFGLPLLLTIFGTANETLIAVAGIGFTVVFFVGFLVYLLLVLSMTRQLRLAIRRGEAIPRTLIPGDRKP